LISDGHFSGVHEKGYTALCQFIKDNYEKIEGLTFNGDIFSNTVLCHWNDNDYSKQIEVKEKYKSFMHEVAKTREMIHHLVSLATGDGERTLDLIYKKGNHEISSFSKLKRKSIVHFLSNMLDLDPLLKLTENNFKIIGGKKPYFINKVPILHGHEMHRNMAFKNFGRMATIGHQHRGSCDSMGVVLPTLEDQNHVDYFQYWKSPWGVGWGVITSFKGVSEKPVNFLVKQGKYLGLKGIKKIGKLVKIVLPKQLDVFYDL
jgi:UDP-2,3-diacylglucosamine pyrophosphatase LpxH